MGMLSPLSDTARGFRTYLQGVGWLRSHPKYLAMVFVPGFLGLLLFIVAWNSFFRFEDDILNWVLFSKPESFWGIALYYVSMFFVYLSALLLGIVTCILLSSVIASPIYEYVSMAVETDLTGKPAPELSFLGSLKLMGEELKKVIFILFISVVMLFIPGLNVLSIIVTAIMVGWDFYDYPLARRGWSFQQRFQFLKKDLFAVMGLGFWMVIPFVQLFMMPLAVAGGTILSVTALKNKNQL